MRTLTAIVSAGVSVCSHRDTLFLAVVTVFAASLAPMAMEYGSDYI